LRGDVVVVNDNRAVLHVPAREIPVPGSISPEAQAVLAGTAVIDATEYPALDDPEGWRALVSAQDETVLAMMSARASSIDAVVVDVELDGVRIFDVTPANTSDVDRVVLDIHGGALYMGGGPVCRAMGATTSGRIGRRTWAVDYRMPPAHPYPAPLDDCVAAYRRLLRDHRPQDIIVSGASAGGNLAAALILRVRDQGLPLPAAAVLLTPEVDLTESGDTFRANLGVDTVLTKSLMPANLLYANGHDLADPYLSPLFGDFVKGFPPTFLASGTRDLFLSNAVRMHRALRSCGIEAELHILEAAPHGGFFGFAPEDAELDRELRRFVDTQFSRSS
jgi:epsilon-lactone hydrolase